MNKVVDRAPELRSEVAYGLEDIEAEGAIVSTGF
jgi:hypothetical protein